MPTYRVTRGDHRREDGTFAEVGDTVELTERQTEQFNMTRFERVTGDEESETEEAEPEDDASETEELEDPPEASTDIPDDWDLLRSMAIVVSDEYGEDVNGQSARDEITGVLEEYEPEELAQIRQRAEARLED